ncbi:MAG: Na+/H+ antiporter NhaA [Gammaproteobacteria bacterium]|jgi:NhaA family Na+:H+ antiporter|nr:Na+/H+ antiporter NhaA [Gammaproteobacteria bacterium]
MKIAHFFKKLSKNDSLSGLLLILMSIVALTLANSPLHLFYENLIKTQLYLGIDQWRLSKPLLLWINDGVMAVFFMHIGLEIKREMCEGQLSKISQVFLPLVAALGGIIVPAVIYSLFNHKELIAMKGWAIPTATDIAFALGVLGLLGSRVPKELKLFLLAIAIFDDLAAIVIIAIFYTSNLSTLSIMLASLAIISLILCNYFNVMQKSVYCFLGILLWFFVLKSGVHTTLAGVILAFTIPLHSKDHRQAPLKDIESSLHGWVIYFILPLFAFANAGINFGNITFGDFVSPLTLGIALGLFLGKQLGVFLFSYIMIKIGMAELPTNTNWKQLYAVAILCGIGFTMSLFMSTLAFQNLESYIVSSRLGIFLGTLLSAFFGYLILRLSK